MKKKSHNCRCTVQLYPLKQSKGLEYLWQNHWSENVEESRKYNEGTQMCL